MNRDSERSASAPNRATPTNSSYDARTQSAPNGCTKNASSRISPCRSWEGNRQTPRAALLAHHNRKPKRRIQRGARRKRHPESLSRWSDSSSQARSLSAYPRRSKSHPRTNRAPLSPSSSTTRPTAATLCTASFPQTCPGTARRTRSCRRSNACPARRLLTDCLLCSVGVLMPSYFGQELNDLTVAG
jgi:hypothetical protein